MTTMYMYMHMYVLVQPEAGTCSTSMTISVRDNIIIASSHAWGFLIYKLLFYYRYRIMSTAKPYNEIAVSSYQMLIHKKVQLIVKPTLSSGKHPMARQCLLV